MIAALVQYQDFTHVALVLIVFAIGQTLEGYVLVPRLVGEKIGLHPVAVIFAVLAGGELFGFLGVLLALPVASVVMVLLRYAHERYRASELYRASDEPAIVIVGEGDVAEAIAARRAHAGSRRRVATSARRFMSAQLPLALRWPAHQRFEAFQPGENAVAIELLRGAARDRTPSALYIAGAIGSGRTHLLIAACAAAGEVQRSAQYLPLATMRSGNAPESIRAFGGSDLLAIDDVDAIAGDRGRRTRAVRSLQPLPRRRRDAAVRRPRAAGTDRTWLARSRLASRLRARRSC